MQEKDKKDLRGRGFSLEDLIDIKEWQKIQNNFSAITEVNLRTVNSNGNLTTLPSRKPRLCSEILKGPSFRNRFCEKCLPTFLGGNEAVDKNLSFICQAGLHNFVTPLRVEGEAWGYIIVGPVVLVMRKPKEAYSKTAQEFCLDLEDFWSAILEIKVVSFHGMQSLIELIKGVGEYTLKLAYQNVMKEKEVIMTTAGKLTKLLDALLDVAFEISQADIGSVMFLDKINDELTIQTSRGIADEIVRKTRVKLGAGISGVAAKEGESFLIDSNTRDNRIRPYLNRPSLSSSMVIPLKIEKKVVGVMNLGALNTSAVRFNQDNMGLMSKLVDFATLAIHP